MVELFAVAFALGILALLVTIPRKPEGRADG